MGFYCRDCGKDVDEKQSDQTMSDTPNTRAVIQAADGRWTYSIKNFCESMERKLTKLQRERDRLAEQIEANHKATLVIERMFYEEREQRDRLAEALNDLWHYHSLTDAAYELIEKALAAVKGGSDDN
jgi:chromosome segregation ATPase